MLDRARLEALRLDAQALRLDGDVRGAADVAGQLGDAEAALAADLAPAAATITGLTSTSSPWLSGAFGWPVQSTTATRTSSPICGAAIPTQWPKRAHRVEQVAHDGRGRLRSQAPRAA